MMKDYLIMEIGMGLKRLFHGRKEFVLKGGLCHFLTAGTVLLFSSVVFAGPSDSDVLGALAENGVSRAITRMATTGEQLKAASEQFCQQKDDESLGQAQQAWKDAYIAWSYAAPFRIGPIKDLQLYKRIGLWRANETIFNGVTTSPEFKGMLDKPEVRGYAGAEYVLFASKEPFADIACGHLVDVTTEIAGLTGRAKEEWFGYKEGFVNAGDGMPFLLENEAMSPVMAEILNVTEFMARERVGLPSNFFAGEAKPETLEGWYSRTTGAGLEATLKGLKTALDGGVPNSMVELVATKDGLVKKKNPKLARAIRKDLKKLEKLLSKVTSDGDPLYIQLEDKSSTLKKLYKQLQKFEEHLEDLSLGLELDVKAGLEAQFLRQQNQ